MKATMVIPSYWARESKVGWQKGDAIYDHPTPLDTEGTLGRLLESIAILEDKDFHLVIIAVSTTEDIADQVEEKVAALISTIQPRLDVSITLFSNSHLSRIHELLENAGISGWTDLLQLRGYSPVRNICLFIPHILGSDMSILIDDDEVFEDPCFISKTREFIGRSIDGKTVNGVAGYYLQPNGNYRLNKAFSPWMHHWDKYRVMDEAFDQFIEKGPRLKEVPFVFGGNMVVHRHLFTKVPFDPYLTRGEDIDFLINARMFGFLFFLDNRLNIKHLAPPKSHPTWMQLREDIARFVYEREKINRQKRVEGMTMVSPEDLDPYPGRFLRPDLEENVEKACKLLAEEYRANGKEYDREETLRTIEFAKTDAVPKHDPFQMLCNIQKRWQEIMEHTGRKEISSKIRNVIGIDK